MTVSLDFTPNDAAFIESQAIAANLTVEDFSRAAILKAANNAAYLKKLEKSEKQIKEGQVKNFTAEEWERFVSEQEV